MFPAFVDKHREFWHDWRRAFEGFDKENQKYYIDFEWEEVAENDNEVLLPMRKVNIVAK